jgi:ribosome-associated protein
MSGTLTYKLGDCIIEMVWQGYPCCLSIVLEGNLVRRIDRKAKAIAIASAKLAGERHCTDIVILDLRKVAEMTDYFVILTGTSDRQMRSVADEITDIAKRQGLSLFGRAGYEQGRWVLLDFIDVVVHIFDAKSREYYDLELLWGDAKKLKID